MKKITKIRVIVSALALFALTCMVQAEMNNVVLILNLQGSWQFSIGTSDEWISPNFDDSDWETIKVPSSWEDQGFNGYNGYAFYRKKFTISSANRNRMLYLYMGYIDDVDEVYLNGKKIGASGSFPPKYATAYNAERKYYIPEELINFGGTNVIAVKVYDYYLQGGIVSGKIGIYGGRSSINMDVNLQGKWKFKTGDNLQYKEPGLNDSDWDQIFVPAKWEDQGYRDYDGYAWYRKSFYYNDAAPDDKLVLLMGKIDDIDQVYINGVLVGSTGSFQAKPGKKLEPDQEYNAFRGYYLPSGVLKKNQTNIISVRVYDKWGAGGIYEGPVGLVTQSSYIEYWRNVKKSGR